ncbi:RNA-binding cell elongation regulator Jag/EloR [Limosilactobacillus vaginalis]|uniref:RNA-binding cell elongation regulator Jag/EloR n=1 Tax=Limosilactobacillus vaginalis TaxID=1633 RepID=UPI001F090591|nr:RNA-binding cell elongation regulator Jag/EloR [Limosilactobacillus vaginalis]
MGRYTGETVEEAVASASKKLGVAVDQLEIKTIQQPRHGFLGIGRREAIVEVSIKKAQKKDQNKKSHGHQEVKQQIKTQQQPKAHHNSTSDHEVDPAEMKRRHEQNVKRVEKVSQELADYLKNVFTNLGIEVKPIVSDVRSHEVRIDLQSEQSGRIIGHHGRRINAMEQLSNAFMNYHGAEKTMVILDTANYRQRREESLHQLAERSVMEVVSTGQAVFLDPMPARERKQLHQELQENDHVKTYSHGRDPYRSVVIAPKN